MSIKMNLLKAIFTAILILVSIVVIIKFSIGIPTTAKDKTLSFRYNPVIRGVKVQDAETFARIQKAIKQGKLNQNKFGAQKEAIINNGGGGLKIKNYPNARLRPMIIVDNELERTMGFYYSEYSVENKEGTVRKDLSTSKRESPLIKNDLTEAKIENENLIEEKELEKSNRIDQLPKIILQSLRAILIRN